MQRCGRISQKTRREFEITLSLSETKYTSFDNLGRLLAHQQITDGQTYQTSYQYDAFGKLLSETYPSGRTVKMDYDQDGDVSHVWGTVGTQNRSYANAISYNSAGAMERLRLGNGKWETAKYNERLQVTEIGLGNSATDKSLLKLEFGYGNNTQNNGSMRSQKISFNGLANPFEQTYAYDDLNRLLSAEEKVSGNTTWKQTFTLDRYGNRRFDAANTTTLGSCSTAVCNPSVSTANNRISQSGYNYDANGALTQDATGQRFGYDAESHQKEFFVAGNNTSTPDATYAYDGDGRRVKKISSTETTVFVYDGGGQMVAEYSTNVVPQTDAKVAYMTTDHLGSPRVVTDANGVTLDRKDFNAFGDETITSQRITGLGYTSGDAVRRDYTGYEKDSESGLEFAQARYYNSQHGRFTSVDPLMASANVKNPQTLNRYSYALNSPYKFTDPLGLLVMEGYPDFPVPINRSINPGGRGMDNFDPGTATAGPGMSTTDFAPPPPDPSVEEDPPGHRRLEPTCPQGCHPQGAMSPPIQEEDVRLFAADVLGYTGNYAEEIPSVVPVNEEERVRNVARYFADFTMVVVDRTGNERTDYAYEISYQPGQAPLSGKTETGKQSPPAGGVPLGPFNVDSKSARPPSSAAYNLTVPKTRDWTGTITIYSAGQNALKISFEASLRTSDAGAYLLSIRKVPTKR